MTRTRIIIWYTTAVVLGAIIGLLLGFGVPPVQAAPLGGGAKFDLGGQMPSGYKAAVSQQTAHTGAFAHAWNTGSATFGSGGIPVLFVPMSTEQSICGATSIGCHGQMGNSLFIVVANNLGMQLTQYVIDHEILETLVDPYPATDPTIVNGRLAEVCDPYQWETFDPTGHWVLAEWVYPNYFNN